MNVPGVAEGNWQWRFDWDQVREQQVQQLRDWIQLYGRKIH
jgi:4-alpha-glucanotransferase